MIPKRDAVPQIDTWDLSALYTDDKTWEADLERLAAAEPRIAAFTGTLARDAATLRAYFDLSVEVGLLQERLGYYAMLRQSEDAGDDRNQDRYARFMQVASRIGAAESFATPEIQAIEPAALQEMLATGFLKGFERTIDRIVRFRPYTLDAERERLLAMQQEGNQTPYKAFSALIDVDMVFGEVDTPQGPRTLSQSSFGALLEHRDRDVRQRAFGQFYRHFDGHKNTLTALIAGSVQQDVYRARVRSFPSALEMSLFPDNVPVGVYETLIAAVHDRLPALHRYYRLRADVLKIPDFALFDTKVPIVGDIEVRTSFDQAVEMVLDAVQPLGQMYVDTLAAGLRGRWVDKYENQGKRSGAFSAGSYLGEPYILMNYKEDSFRDVFTLAHEAGHSMHSWYSVRNQPFQDYQYTIFEAEVASTLNEQLLVDALLKRNPDGAMRAYLINKQVDDIIATLFRQTMFAEYELLLHERVESGGAITIDFVRRSYRELLERYFGPTVQLPENADLEGLRIPHFYRAFYVYKYATGLSAAITLAQRILQGGASEREDWLNVLKSGGSRFPIDALQLAGVDMRTREPIDAALAVFERYVEELELRTR